jgi:hypothetical protein
MAQRQGSGAVLSTKGYLARSALMMSARTIAFRARQTDPRLRVARELDGFRRRGVHSLTLYVCRLRWRGPRSAEHHSILLSLKEERARAGD